MVVLHVCYLSLGVTGELLVLCFLQLTEFVVSLPPAVLQLAVHSLQFFDLSVLVVDECALLGDHQASFLKFQLGILDLLNMCCIGVTKLLVKPITIGLCLLQSVFDLLIPGCQVLKLLAHLPQSTILQLTLLFQLLVLCR